MLKNYQDFRSWLMAEGIVFIILGILAIALPFVFTVAVTVIFGILLIAGGAFGAVRILNMEEFSGKWAEWIFMIALIVVGILMVISPERGALTLTALLIALFMLAGIAKIVASIQARHIPGWPWMLVSGILSILLAWIIIAGWPGTALWALGLLLGINMLIFGSAALLMGISLKQPPIDRY